MACSDGEEGRKKKKTTTTKQSNKKKKNKKKINPSFPITAQGNLATEPRANPKNRVVDESPPEKSSFPKKGTTKSKLKHLNKKVFSELYESSHV